MFAPGPAGRLPIANTMRISLSEQAEIEYRVAGFGSRALAYTFDFLIRWTVALAFVLATIFVIDLLNAAGFSIGNVVDLFLSATRDSARSQVMLGLLVLLVFLIEWGYPIGFEVFNQGVTPGKQLCGLRVVDENGLPIDFKTSAMRTIMLLVDLLPGIAAVGFLSMAMTKRYQRLGDLVARTMVIYDEEREFREYESFRRSDQPARHRLPLSLYNLIEGFVRREPELLSDVRKRLQADISASIKVAVPELREGSAANGVFTKQEMKDLLAVSEPIREQYQQQTRHPHATN